MIKYSSKLLVAIMCFQAAALLYCVAAGALPAPEYKTRIIAHRGASAYAPENTMASFEKARELGADMIELDIHRTLDGHIVVIHDPDTDRTTGVVNKIRFMKLSDIRKLDAGSWMSEKFKDERIPTLYEVLKWAKDKIQVNIEIKSDGCEKKVVKMVEKLDMTDQVIVSSFHHEYLLKIKELNPEIHTGALVGDINSKADLDKIIEACRPDAVNPRYIAVTRTIVKAAHKRGLAVNVYTVDDPVTMKRLIKYGVDGIITNYPDVLDGILKKYAEKQQKKK